MPKANRKILLKSGREQIWELVTSLENWAWRSDLRGLEIVEPGRRFVEIDKGGIRTGFTITDFEPMRRYALELEYENLRGRWEGRFAEGSDGVELTFTEEVKVKRAAMKPLAGIYLRVQQKRYFRDLKTALGE